MEGTCTTIADESRHRSLFRISIYLPFLYLFFFFNTAGLPAPLEYTTILSPLFYFWLAKNNYKYVITPFLLVSMPFVAIHLSNGVVLKTYLTSYLFVMAIYIVAYAFYVAVTKSRDVNKLLQHIIIINFVFACAAILIKNSSFSELLWWDVSAGVSLGQIKRLKLLTYEASHYSTLLAPFFVYSFLNMIVTKRKNRFVIFILVLVPMMLSFSFGVISSLIITLVIVQLLYFKNISKQNKLYGKVIFPLAFVLILIALLKTPFSERLGDVMSGNDLSGSGRAYFSSIIAIEVARQKSLWWGVGFGQAKGYYDVMVSFMRANYKQGWMNEFLYNSIADLFAATGIVGIALKLFAEFYLFFKTRVFQNYFSLSLFIFIFIYQFTGSFLTNIAEYAVWIFAFARVFPEFDISRVNTPQANRLQAPPINSTEVA